MIPTNSTGTTARTGTAGSGSAWTADALRPGDRPSAGSRLADTLDAVVAVTGALPVVVPVTAVLVTRGRTAFLERTLAAVRAQTRLPDTLVVVDVATSPDSAGSLDLQLGEARFVPGAGARTFGEAVERGLAAVGGSGSGWLWLLHDDSAPEPQVLAELLRAVEHTTAVAVAGCKQRRWEVDEDGRPVDGRGVLVEVGHTLTPTGRRTTGVDEDEIDQGQHDGREDVLAVALAGSLVRRQVWDALGGTDPELGRFNDGTDLCWRARLAGHRVVVVPRAVIHHAQASYLGLRERGSGPGDPDASFGARRRSDLHLRLVSVAGPLVPLAALAMILWAPFRAAYRLALKQPVAARDELLAPLWAVLRVPGVVRARRRSRATRVLRRRDLAPLRTTWRQVLSERRDRRLARAEVARTRFAPTDLERTELRHLALRRRAVLTVVLLALAGLTAVLFGGPAGTLLAGGRLVGGALLPAATTLGDVWAAATSGWVQDGLGLPAGADPVTAALVPLTALAGGSTQTAVNLLLVGSVLLAGLGAWFAAGALTRSPWLRAWAAVAWVAAPPFLAALGTGRLGALLAHLALPWVALGVLRALGAQRTDVVEVPESRGPRHARRTEVVGSLGAAAAAGLALAVAVAGAPALLPAACVVLVVVAVAARRHRRYLALVPVPALVVALPLLAEVVTRWSDGGWRLLLAEPGAPLSHEAVAPWELLLGVPQAPDAWFGGDGAAGWSAGWAETALGLAPYAYGGLLVLLALVALLRRRAVAGARVAWVLAAVGLAGAVVTAATTVATGADGFVTGWPGALLSLLLLGLVGGAVLGLPREAAATAPRRGGAPGPGRRRARVAGLALLTVVALGVPAAATTAWALDNAHADLRVGSLVATGSPVVPAVGRQAQETPRAARVLWLSRDDAGAVSYALLRGDGTRLTDASVVVQAAGLLGADAGDDPGRTDTLVADLTNGTGADLAVRLADVGVGVVQVPHGDTGSDAELVARLDMVEGLDRMTEGARDLLWRVAPAGEPEPGWARLTDAAPTADGDRPATLAVLPSTGRSASAVVEEGPEGRTVVLAEHADDGWWATLDGRPLAAVDADGLQAFALGADGGSLEVGYDPLHRTAWLALAGVVLGVFVLLALPVGRRRTRWAA